MGTFFLSNHFDTGITAQSHAGKNNPKKTPIIEPINLFFGINFDNCSSDIYVSIIEDINEPNNRKGRLSKNIEVNIIEIFFIISINITYINKSIIIPTNTPTKYIIDSIFKFSFISLFVLNNNNIPNPLPVNNPAIKLPKVIILDKYNSVIMTLLAQLGINPIKLAIK